MHCLVEKRRHLRSGWLQISDKIVRLLYLSMAQVVYNLSDQTRQGQLLIINRNDGTYITHQVEAGFRDNVH
jgi:hypothetical protein